MDYFMITILIYKNNVVLLSSEKIIETLLKLD